MRPNEKEGVCYMQPTTIAERAAIANDFITRTGYDLPLLLDDMNNSADDAFAGWPERLYVIGADGTIAYKGGTGPFNFDPEELDAWLASNLSPTPG